MNKITKITVTRVRGMRDFFPQEMLLRKRVISTIESVYERFGFEPVATPALEFLSVLKAKCGEEASGQIYEIEDMGLRFEFTTGLARMIATSSVPKPFKAYQIGPVWRRDEPQRGRYREFWQADADIIGSSSMKCEAELLACASEALKKLKINKFKIRLNNIKTLNSIIESVGIPSELIPAVKRALDKIKKKGEESVKKEMEEKGISSSKIEKLFTEIKKKNLKNLDETEEGISELNKILVFAKAYNIKDIEIDFSLARGLAYYTGPVFEFESTEDLGSICGGGRYDDLLGIYGSPSPAVGISFGIDRIVDLIKIEEEKKKEEKKKENFSAENNKEKKIYLTTVDDTVYPYSIKVAQLLRKKGIDVYLDLTERNLKKQFEYANAINASFVGVIGAKEVKEKKVTIRNLKTGKEKMISVDKIDKMLIIK